MTVKVVVKNQFQLHFGVRNWLDANTAATDCTTDDNIPIIFIEDPCLK